MRKSSFAVSKKVFAIIAVIIIIQAIMMLKIDVIVAKYAVLILSTLIIHELGHAFFLCINRFNIKEIDIMQISIEKVDNKFYVKFKKNLNIGVLGQVIIDIDGIVPQILFCKEVKNKMLLYLLGGPMFNCFMIVEGFVFFELFNNNIGNVITITNIIFIFCCIGESRNSVGDLRAAYNMITDDTFYFLMIFSLCTQSGEYLYIDELIKYISNRFINLKKSSYKNRLYLAIISADLLRDNNNIDFEVVSFLKDRYIDDSTYKSYYVKCLLGELLIKYQDYSGALKIYQSISKCSFDNHYKVRLENKLNSIKYE